MPRRLISIFDLVLTLATWTIFALGLALILSRDTATATDMQSRSQDYVRAVEFDFLDWTFSAAGVKLSQASARTQAYLPEADQVRLVVDWFGLRRELDVVENAIAQKYADPAVADPAAATAELRSQQADLRASLRARQPLVEAILQDQLAAILYAQGLTAGGAPVPPVAFHITALPYAVVISPRHVIRQDAMLDVNGDLTLDEQVALEDRLAAGLEASTLIVPLGGIGTYPTMIGQTSDLNWVAATIAHEWVHNYLTLRPLGISYLESSALRTMNETTAEMTGDELGALLMARYYPDLAPPPAPFANLLDRDQAPREAQAPAFDFRAEMHATRVTADALLAEGRVDDAEVYMEARRAVFWGHGYQIRKLNQAYFAFYGAYASGGGGASGGDPVGNAVRLLRRRSPSIAAFVNTIAGFNTYDDLRIYLGLPE